MTVPHVQLKYQKCVLALLRSVLRDTGGGASYLGLCLCVSAVRRKIKIQNQFKSRGGMAPGGGTATFLLPSTPLAYSKMRLFSLLFLLMSGADK